MNAKTIESIISVANHARRHTVFTSTVINRNWIHIGDSATTACYRVADIASLGEEAMRRAFMPGDEDNYSHWCSSLRAYHLDDMPKYPARLARDLGLVTENW